MSQLKAAVRCKAIDMAGLTLQEKHGKREDALSKKRRIRDASPLVYKGLDLREQYDTHIDGAKINSAAKKTVLHFIIRFPPSLLDSPQVGRFTGSKQDRHKQMLQQAVKFIEENHGGDSVFAARVDRDEEGETIVDVFATPRYEKRTKKTPADKPGVSWISATKFGKELAEKHAEEIRRRHPKAKGSLTKPRHVGIALQSEFAQFFEATNGVKLAAKVEKKTSHNDRIEKESHDALEAKRAEIEERSAHIESRASEVELEKIDLARREAELSEAQKEVSALHSKIEQERSALGRIRDRLRGLVTAFGQAFGLPLPDKLSSAVDALEAEMAAASEEIEDPFSAAPEDPADDAFGL